MTKQQNTELRQEWERRIANFKSSGLTQTKWCEVNDMNIHQLKYWLKRIVGANRTSTPASNWVPVLMDEPSETNESLIQIKVGQATIEVKPNFDPTHLANVVRALGSLC